MPINKNNKNVFIMLSNLMKRNLKEKLETMTLYQNQVLNIKIQFPINTYFILRFSNCMFAHSSSIIID